MFCRGIHDGKEVIFGVLRKFPMVVDFSWVVLFVSALVFFFPSVWYLRKKLSTTEIGNKNDTHPPPLIFKTL